MKPQAEMVEVIAEGERLLAALKAAEAEVKWEPANGLHDHAADLFDEFNDWLRRHGRTLLSAARQAERMRKALEDIAAHPGPHDDESAHWCADTARAALARAGAT